MEGAYDSCSHVEDFCVGGVAVMLNDMAKLTLSHTYTITLAANILWA